MSLTFALFIILGFVAVVLLLEGVFVYWNDTKSPEVRRVEQRLRAMSAGGQVEGGGRLFKQRMLSNTPALQQLLLKMPRAGQLDRLLQQAGKATTVSHLLTICLLLMLGGLIAGMLLRWAWPVTLLASAGLAVLPFLQLLRSRTKRLHLIEAQLPDAMDLMSRALRAGHAFASALSMAGRQEIPSMHQRGSAGCCSAPGTAS